MTYLHPRHDSHANRQRSIGYAAQIGLIDRAWERKARPLVEGGTTPESYAALIPFAGAVQRRKAVVLLRFQVALSA